MRDQLVEFKMPRVTIKEKDYQKLKEKGYEIIEKPEIRNITIYKNKKEIAQINLSKLGELYFRNGGTYRIIKWVEITLIQDGIRFSMGDEKEKPRYYAQFQEKNNKMNFLN